MTRTMKDSGIDWIGEIPEDWNMNRLKALLIERKEKNDPVKTEFILSLGANYGVIPYAEKDGGGNKAKEDFTQYKLAYPDDIVMNSMNIVSGSVGLSKYYGCVSPVYYMFHPRTKDINIRYYHHMFQTKVFQRSLLGLGNGIMMKESSNGNLNTVRMRIPVDKLNAIQLPVPSMPEQEKIADFLDEKCSHIDSVLEKTRASIEEYKQLKQSVITQAVTKGIRPNRPMKDSGIEWIGEIPEDWKVKKLKYSCNNRNENYSSDYGALEYFALENIESKSAKFIHTENVYDIAQSQICKENDVVFGKLRPYLAKVYQVPTLCCCSGEFAVFCDFEGVADYYKYIMLSHWFINIVDASTYGTKMPRANIQFIKNMDITVPSKTEQTEIVSYLDDKCSEIDKLITKKEQLIEELETYKKSLIYEYVTGKKEVC